MPVDRPIGAGGAIGSPGAIGAPTDTGSPGAPAGAGAVNLLHSPRIVPMLMHGLAR
jgi:hypothetical protein